MARLDEQQEMDPALRAHLERNPEEDSEFARTRRRAARVGAPPGVDPRTGERKAVSYREVFNASDSEEEARQRWNELKHAAGVGEIADEQYIDISSIERSVVENKVAADRSMDKFDRHRAQQQAMHQDHVANEVRDILEDFSLNKVELKKPAPAKPAATPDENKADGEQTSGEQ